MKKGLFTRVLNQLVIAMLVVLLVLLPSEYADELMQGTVSGKMFFFLYTILIIGVLLLLKTIFKFPTHVCFGKIDGILLVWTAYILLNGFFQQMPLSIRLLEFFGLIVLYVTLRQIRSSKYQILLIAMIIGGTVQAVYGNLQLWGYYPSHHNLFRITGSFFNPGPYAGYLASVFPAVLGICLLKIHPFPLIGAKLIHVINKLGYRIPNKFRPVKFSITVLMTFVLMVILIILPATRSRAAWLAVGVSTLMIFMVRYPMIQWLKNRSWGKRGVVILLLCVILGAGILWLFRFKADSANGRLLIWKITGIIISEHPITGVGFDRFNASYMNEQACYFKQNSKSPETMVAGDVNYAFNEFFQHTAENGLIGFMLLLSILVYAFRVTNKLFDHLVWVAKSGIVGIAIFALFSYPAQVLPIKVSLTVYLSCLSVLAEQKTWQMPVGKHIPVKCALITCMVVGLVVGVKYLNVNRTAWKSWNLAYWAYMMGDNTGSLPHYERAWSMLNTNGDFLTNYGKALSLAGEHEKAIVMLRQAALHYPNTVVYTTSGDSYKVLGKITNSEHSYLHAWYMNPSRFYPKYLLAKLYDETGQADKAIAVARELLDKEVKIKSSAIDEIRREMEKILKKYRNTTVGFKLQKWRSPQGEKNCVVE